MLIIESERSLIKSWCNHLEEGVLHQARNLANLPFLFKHVCLMPDTHQGFGMPIGGVIACEEVIIPNAVGVDIGCGMLAVKTSLQDIEHSNLKSIMGETRRVIPVGFKHHKEKQIVQGLIIPEKNCPLVKQESHALLFQLGTLGGGNHFIEFQRGSDGHIWFMIHSGSRNLGKKVADHYNNLAKELNRNMGQPIPQAWDLAFLPLARKEADNYIREMGFCLEFALHNRQLMAKKIKNIMYDLLGCDFLEEVNIHHNYAASETHYRQQVMIHRKGATSARQGEIGIIPGSQGTSSYIVRGKGNPESFTSSSHGAGRKMGRNEAKRILNLVEEKAKLEERGIIHAVRSQNDLEEAAGAYKDIDVVMEEQKDLVEIVVKLEPLGVIKG